MVITKGHIVFAAIFSVVFLLIILFLYWKDLKLHKVYYKGATKVILVIIVIIACFALFVKKFLH